MLVGIDLQNIASKRLFTSGISADYLDLIRLVVVRVDERVTAMVKIKANYLDLIRLVMVRVDERVTAMVKIKASLTS